MHPPMRRDKIENEEEKNKQRQNELATGESHVTAQMPKERWHLFIIYLFRIGRDI